MAHDMNWNRSFAVDGAPGAGVLAGYLLIASGVNAGNAALSTAKALGFVGVTKEASDARGYVAAALAGVIDVIAGSNVTAGNMIASDANGKGAPVTLINNGTTVTQVVGVALTTALAGNTFKLLIQPQIGLS